MSRMKRTLEYHFSVEGETEKWYLDWLQKIINNELSATHKVSIKSKIEKNPLKRVKSMSVLNNIEITHLFDYESNEDVHTVQFIKTLDLLKESSKLGKQLKYHLAYSNFTFELWMVLHKADCNTSFAHRREYLGPINRAYTEHFENLDEYKNQTVFKRVLGKISLSDVKAAINRAKIIMQKNKENGLKLEKYKGYEYYKDNPSLSVGDSLEKILKDCGL